MGVPYGVNAPIDRLAGLTRHNRLRPNAPGVSLRCLVWRLDLSYSTPLRGSLELLVEV